MLKSMKVTNKALKMTFLNKSRSKYFNRQITVNINRLMCGVFFLHSWAVFGVFVLCYIFSSYRPSAKHNIMDKNAKNAI